MHYIHTVTATVSLTKLKMKNPTTYRAVLARRAFKVWIDCTLTFTADAITLVVAQRLINTDTANK